MMESPVHEVQSISSLYDFDQVLGEGSFASVWRVTPKDQPDKKLAIKQVHVHPLEKDMAYRQVENLEKVQSDHIIKYYTSIYDTSEKTLNLIMELCRGSLRGQLASRVFSRQELLSFIVQINSAFLELLDKKLMHLDLKPQNILVSQTNPNCYKICDFGCAQIAIQSKLTRYDNQLFGTFNYLAPENYLNYHGKLTNTSADIWSLGVILYEMIYKRLPLEVGPDGLIKRKEIQQYFQGSEEKIAFTEGPNAPPDVLELVKKMLKPKPKNRISWMGLKEELMGRYGVDEYAFFNTKKIYFKHLKVTKIFLTFIIILRKDSELNPHPFWRNNRPLLTELSETLLHLAHLFSLKFQVLYEYKFTEFLENEWLQGLDFMRTHIGIEEAVLAARKEQKTPDLSDLVYYEEVLRNCVKEVQAQLALHAEYWVTMEDLDLFCQQTIRRGEAKKSFFASGDNDTYGQTMKALDIQ